MSEESRRALQQAVDDAYESRCGWVPEEIRSVLIARLGQLRFELTDAEIDEWAVEISEGQRIQIRMKGTSALAGASIKPTVLGRIGSIEANPGEMS